MHKKIAAVWVLSILCIIFAFYEWEVFCEISDKNARQRQFQNRVMGINLEGVHVYKSAENLLFDRDKITFNSLESQLKSITKLCKTRDVKIDNINQFELILSCDSEKNIMDCLKKLYLQLNGLVKFQTIKMVKRKGEIKAKIICKIIYFNTENLSGNIKIYPQKISYPDTCLFKTKNKHQLLATVNNSQAFIDDDWREIGEHIDEDNVIISIGQYTILVKNDGQVKTIHIGEKW